MAIRTLIVVCLMILLLALGCASQGAAAAPLAAVPFWPPRLDQPYPDLQLLDATGRQVRLSDYRGKVLLIEPMGVDCPACQAFAGAHADGVGPLRNCTPQQNLRSIEELTEQYAGVSLDDPRLVYIQLLLYNWTQNAPPTLDEAREWAEHFGADRRPNQLGLVAAAEISIGLSAMAAGLRW